MTAPDPPAVYWCARTGELATDYTAGMVYLDEHHRPPDDAVRLVPEQVNAPSEETKGATANRDHDQDSLRQASRTIPRPGVAALLRRCDEEEARVPVWDSAAIPTAVIRALLGGADNNNKGERRG